MNSDWRKIDSAPKDGTEILACSVSGGTGVMIARWIAMSDFLTDAELAQYFKDGESEDMLDEPDWFFADFVQGDRLPRDCYPSHWLPLPPPPPRQEEE